MKWKEGKKLNLHTTRNGSNFDEAEKDGNSHDVLLGIAGTGL